MSTYKNIGNSLIIIIECMALRYGVLAAKNKEFLELENK